MILRRSARYFCLSASISGSVRQGLPCAFQYAFQASSSFVVGRCNVVFSLPSCLLIGVSHFFKNNRTCLEKLYSIFILSIIAPLHPLHVHMQFLFCQAYHFGSM